MKTLFFLLLSVSLSAQLTVTPKIIYKANNQDTISIGFMPSNNAVLTVTNGGDIVDDAVSLSGYHVLNLVVDSGSAVTASATGSIAYTVYKNGVNVTPVPISDNSLQDTYQWYIGLTTTQKNKVITALIYLNKEGLKKIKALIK